MAQRERRRAQAEILRNAEARVETLAAELLSALATWKELRR